MNVDEDPSLLSRLISNAYSYDNTETMKESFVYKVCVLQLEDVQSI